MHLIKKSLFVVFIIQLLLLHKVHSQHANVITAIVDDTSKGIAIQQEFDYKNDSKDTLTTIYFNDWANAYANKTTPLAKRFEREFKKSLHLAKDKERGKTTMISAVDENRYGLTWERTKESDLIKVKLNTPLLPNESFKMFLTYTVKLPPNKFTLYGYASNGGYYLKDWYLTPAVYTGNGKWELYSNKNLEDLYTGITNTIINITYPTNLSLITNFNNIDNDSISKQLQVNNLEGNNRKSCEIILTPRKKFTKHITPHLTVISDISTKKYDEISKGISINKVSKYIKENLGEFPHEHLVVSKLEYYKNPLYGLNLLPSYIRPYEPQFQFEMMFLKTALNAHLKETLFLNPRKDKWINDAIQNYLMIKYVDTHYPKEKLLGKLSKIWGLKSWNLAKLDFNAQYPLLSMLTARKNTDQSLTTSNDSLLKFNQKIANSYKAGLGLAYLSDYIGQENIDNSIKTFYKNYHLKKVTPKNFKNTIKERTNENIDWFFNEYVSSEEKIDFKIKKVTKLKDSLAVTIKNKEGTNVPISMFGLLKDSVVSKYWFSNVAKEKTFMIPRNGEKKLVLNYNQKIPEVNQRNNWKSLNGFLSSNKKLKFQFFKDAENPYYNQIFYVPIASFNIYDGITPGIRLHNKTILNRPFLFDFNPSYATLEKTLVGFGKINYTKFHGKSGLYVSNYSLRASTSHFQTNSRFTTFTPSVSFGWRPDDLLSNKRQSLSFRYINIFRNLDNAVTEEVDTDPNYSVFNARYRNSNRGIINYLTWSLDGQLADRFSKLSVNLEYRKLFESNRQLNLRFYAGKFITNNTNSDFFNFSLDRPKDYLFDYNFIGRSEDSGLVSQQIIIAEGGFKSKLNEQYRFSNDWIATTNASFNVWRWIELYGDIGLVKNRGFNEKFVYDSGVRLNLVTDYFELYFPVYSNNGWEIAQQNYDEKIRFIVTLSPKTLIRLFTRKWF